MFSELSHVMNRGMDTVDFNNILQLNVANKLSNSNLIKTNRYLKQLYQLDISDLPFRCFQHYWNLSDDNCKPILSLLFAINNDTLLRESVDLVVASPLKEKIAIEKFDENIESFHPGRYSANTRRSAAQNIASSWKQAGYIEGKVRSIRIEPGQTYQTVAFAFLLSYLNGERGDFILTSKVVKALAIENEKVRDLIRQAATHDLVQYQHGGNVTFISFENQLNQIHHGQ